MVASGWVLVAYMTFVASSSTRSLGSSRTSTLDSIPEIDTQDSRLYAASPVLVEVYADVSTQEDFSDEPESPPPHYLEPYLSHLHSWNGETVSERTYHCLAVVSKERIREKYLNKGLPNLDEEFDKMRPLLIALSRRVPAEVLEGCLGRNLADRDLALLEAVRVLRLPGADIFHEIVDRLENQVFKNS